MISERHLGNGGQGIREARALLGDSPGHAHQNLPDSQIRSLFPEYIGQSRAIKDLLHLVYKASKTDSSVLVYGESGTGKELIASAIHRLSARSAKRFVPSNCSAIPENLLESELFGNEKGAFTGATNRRVGLFEYAQGGTIFLDEIGEMPPNLQVKLLRVLQEKEYSPVGASYLKKADVRIVAATNVKLEEALKDTRFRLDLYYRLNVLPITLPPLRERGDDVTLLLEYFLDLMNRKHNNLYPCYLDPEALVLLKNYPWPGNIRELQNVVERLVVVSGGGPIGVALLPEEILDKDRHYVPPTTTSKPQQAEHMAPKQPPEEPYPVTAPGGPILPDCGVNLTKIIEELENTYILQALEKTGNNKNQAARLLGLNRTTLVERIKKRKIAPLNLPSKEL